MRLLAAVALVAELAPPPALPSLPVLSRVRLDVAPAHVVVTEDVRFARGDWSGGDLDLYVAFGAPGVPRAFDARLFALRDGELEPAPDAPSEPVATERAFRRPPRARLLLGREAMAGVVVRLKEPALRRAFADGGALALRLRSLVPTEGAARELVVRLGASGGAPIAVAAIDVAGADVSSARARFCGPNADPYPLAVRVPSGRAAPVTHPRPASPLSVTQHADDDLCVAISP